MSGIVLSASVRQNLLSLQSTADLLATTQNRLATGKKVNTALDNPTNFFTALGLDNRASDINNLLDGIGNGVQVLQAANTGISSLQKLVDSAKSVANQVLQAPVGYSTKSTFIERRGHRRHRRRPAWPATLNNTVLTGSSVNNNLSTPVAITAATKLLSAATSDTLATTLTGVLTVNGKTITFSTGQTTSTTDGSGNVHDRHRLRAARSRSATAHRDRHHHRRDGFVRQNGADAGKLAHQHRHRADLVISGTGTSLTAFGLTAGTTNRITALSGLTLTIGATGNGTATNITFGDGTSSTVKSLNDLNAKLAANNLYATFDSSSGKITITDDQRRGVFADRHDRRYVDRFGQGVQQC